MPLLNLSIKIVLFLIGFVVVLSLFQFYTSIRPPRYYSNNTPADYDLKYENVSFTTSDNIKIDAWVIESEKANGTIIVGHGYPFDKGNVMSLALFLYPEYNLVYYDHRYFGKSSGAYTTVGMKEVEDVKAAINYVQKRFGKKEPIALYGVSLSASAMIMSKPQVNAIIADSAYANLENMIKHVYNMFSVFKYPFVKLTNLYSILLFHSHPKDISPALAAKEINVPILLIHGDKDSQIPVENAYQIIKQNPNIESWIVKGSDHIGAHHMHKAEYEKKVKDFLKKNMN
jgi:pimeloyl-ACP methyl ester carboxylesterase